LSKHDVKLLAATFERGDVVAHAQPAGPRVRLADTSELRILYAAQA
jgi:hypothetical protein